jgi:hypothetical protein
MYRSSEGTTEEKIKVWFEIFDITSAIPAGKSILDMFWGRKDVYSDLDMKANKYNMSAQRVAAHWRYV